MKGILLILIWTLLAQAANALPLDESKLKDSVSKIALLEISGKKGAVVVGITDGIHHFVYSFGTSKQQQADEHTLFEVGSLSKIFTALLLADFWRNNKVSFDDAVKKFLPADVIVPQENGKQITLFQLATHSSGMPRNADNFEQFPKYGKVQFHDFLKRCKLVSPPGSKYLYSNAGFTLLGEVLECVGQRPYEDLLVAHILQPLRMDESRIVLDEEQTKKLADCFGKDGQEINSSPVSGGPAGGLKSSVHDLLLLLDAAIIKNENAVSKDIVETLRRRFSLSPSDSACLGWFRNDNRDTFGKLGQIHGFSSAVEFSPSRKLGFVVLSSTLQAEAPALIKKIASRISNNKIKIDLR